MTLFIILRSSILASVLDCGYHLSCILFLSLKKLRFYRLWWEGFGKLSIPFWLKNLEEKKLFNSKSECLGNYCAMHWSLTHIMVMKLSWDIIRERVVRENLGLYALLLINHQESPFRAKKKCWSMDISYQWTNIKLTISSQERKLATWG